MRFAGQMIMNTMDETGEPGASVDGVTYPQDGAPAGYFGVDPTEIPLMRDRFIMSPKGGVAQMAPSMMDGYIDNPAAQDTGLPYIVGPEIQRQRRDSMNQFMQVPPNLLPPNLRGV